MNRKLNAGYPACLLDPELAGTLAGFMYVMPHMAAALTQLLFIYITNPVVHTASSGTIGKEHENYASIMFDRKRVHKMIRDAYEGLLTDEEIANVLKGQDYYFDADELGERLENFTEFQQKKFEAELEAI